ncbi:hypothetical protein AVEN_203441-1 [Araneus ventricosus]|uniref:Uncharacterized protein n=1 Tax=Araneus ventricosus TaxID=182803 RepID=A0A4Y2BG98_ARAVE|nr:hypothetical protein AVEN_203441-1 [Araneus ventricosus]
MRYSDVSCKNIFSGCYIVLPHKKASRSYWKHPLPAQCVLSLLHRIYPILRNTSSSLTSLTALQLRSLNCLQGELFHIRLSKTISSSHPCTNNFKSKCPNRFGASNSYGHSRAHLCLTGDDSDSDKENADMDCDYPAKKNLQKI